MTDTLMFTCEHGGNRVPARYRALFTGLRVALETHRGHDFGALLLAREMAADFGAPLIASTVTRLLVDLNRSVGHAGLHAAPVRESGADVRAQILTDHYRPYRTDAEARVHDAVLRGRRIVHVSLHSFTPELDGQVRGADIGLLYDPRRPGEVQLCAHWKASLALLAPGLRVRRNYPYQGRNDGFTSHLRRAFAPSGYVGIEIEVNQAIVFGPARRWARLRATLIASLRAALAATPSTPT